MEAKVGIEPTWTALQTVAFVSPLCHFAKELIVGMDCYWLC